jgi:tryptophan synthase alpha subunit
MHTTPDREAIKAVVEQVLDERKRRFALPHILQRVLDVARSERAARWAKYAAAALVGSALHHALANPCALP